MTFAVADRVKESTTSTGTGTINLSGTSAGFQGFVAGIGNGNTTYYAISSQTADEWEVGIGTVTDAATDTLSRDTIISSSNSDLAVNFSAGTKDVISTLPSSKAVIETATGVDVTGTIVSDGLTVDTNTLYVDSTNNRVGIGTSSPTSKLHVEGDYGSTLISGTSPKITVQHSGGTNQFVEIQQSGGASFIGTQNGTNDGSLYILGRHTANNQAIFRPNSIELYTAGSERMRINSSGNVGIGTTDINTNGIALSRDKGAITRAFNNAGNDYVEFTGEMEHVGGSGVAFGAQDMIKIEFPASGFSSVFFDMQVMSYTANGGANSATQGSMWRLVISRDTDGDNAYTITEYSTTSVTNGDADPNVSLTGSFSSNVFTLQGNQQTGGISNLNFKATGLVTTVDAIYASDGQTNVSWDSRKKLVYDR